MRATAQHYSLPPVFTRPILTYYRGSGKPIKHSKSPFLPPDLRCCYDACEVGVIAARLPRRDVWYFLFTFFSSCLISSTRLDRLAGRGKITQQHGICLSNHILAMQTQRHCWTSLNKLYRDVMTSRDCLPSVDASGCHGYNRRIPFWRKQTETVQTGVL